MSKGVDPAGEIEATGRGSPGLLVQMCVHHNSTCLDIEARDAFLAK